MVKSIKLETASRRALLLFAAFFCLTVTVFFVKWCFANTIAVRAPSKEVAELSIDLAPGDPQTHYALAVLNEKSFLLEDLPKSLAEYEKATALAPNDFRLWLELGKVRERNGDAIGAENALVKALALAPNYAQIQWTLGNILLRRGKTVEAFNEMRNAAENHKIYQNPFLSTAWTIFDGNLESIKQNIGSSPVLNSKLAVFLANQKRFDEALDIWNALPADEKKSALKENGETLFGQILAAKRYRDALQIQQSLDEKSGEEKFESGKIYNGSFESDIKREKASVFDWQIAAGAQPQIGFDDAQKINGKRSLVIIFNSTNGKDFRSVSQTIAVEANRKYTFEAFYKSDLKTATTLQWEIVDAADGKSLAATNAVSANADWTNLTAEFLTAENTQAITLRLARETCKSIICPISGKIWFDDFNLK